METFHHAVRFPTIMRTDRVLTPPWSSRTPFLILRASLVFFPPTFWMAVTMDTPGRRGVGWADMNRAAKMHLGCGRHGSGVHLTHLLRCCQRNVPRFQAWRWPVADVLPLRRLLHLRLLRHAPEPEAEPILGAPIPSRGGKSDLWPLTRAWEAHHSA